MKIRNITTMILCVFLLAACLPPAHAQEAVISITGVAPGNGQAHVEFAIKSANGKGYSVYISSTGVDGSFKIYSDVNFNSSGAHIKGLENGKTYYVYIVYSENNIVVEQSAVVKLSPSK